MTCLSCGSPVSETDMACTACGVSVSPPTSLSHRNSKAVVFREEKTVLPVRIADVLLNRYRLEEKIGEGGMGTVFIASDLELERKVAIKMLGATFVHDTEVVERFEREARLMAKLDHPHLVPIYDVGRDQGRPFIVMKLLQGDSLVGRLRSKVGFSTEETLQLMRHLASGLDYIHAQGFIHRDIKAGNIFISPEGHATILDFGILRARLAESSLTRAGMVMGTPHYMAPEQALGLKEVDHRVDLYALAVVLFECLTGTLPYEADSELRLIQLQAHAPPPEILERAPWVPVPVGQVMRKALAKKPEDRFNSAAELLAALEEAYAQGRKLSNPQLPAIHIEGVNSASKTLPPGQPPLHFAISPPESPAKSGQGRRAWLWAVVPVVLGAAAGGWWAVGGSAAQVPPPPSVEADAGLPRMAAVAIERPAEAELSDASVVLSDASVVLSDASVEGQDAGALDSMPELSVVKKPVVLTRRNMGTLKIISTRAGEPYWAQVSLDGIPRGRTPLSLEVPVGRYQVRVERPGFRPHERGVRVSSNKPQVVKVELVP